MTTSSIFASVAESKIFRKCDKTIELNVCDVLQTDKFELTTHLPMKLTLNTLMTLTSQYIFVLKSPPKVKDNKISLQVRFSISLRWLQLRNAKNQSSDEESNAHTFEFEGGRKLIRLTTTDADIHNKWLTLLRPIVLHADFTDKYIVKQYLGSGATCKVYRVEQISNKAVYACKRIQKQNMSDPAFFKSVCNEICILTKLRGRPEVVELIEVQESANSIYIVTELLEGDRVTRQDVRYEQEDVLALTDFLLKALICLENEGFVHRDLKPGNVLRKYGNKRICENTLKFIDFGFAIDISKPISSNLHVRCGTAGYIPPDVLNIAKTDVEYDKWDIFSVGVIIYNAMTGKRLFYDADNKIRLRNNQEAVINFESTDFEGYTPKCKLNS